MPFSDKLMSNIQPQRASLNWQEYKMKKSEMALLQLSLQPDNWCWPQDHSCKWTSTQLLSSQLITKLWNSPKKSLLIFLNQLIPQMMNRFWTLFKIVSELNSPVDGENSFLTWQSKLLKSSWEKELKTNWTSKLRDMLELKRFPEALYKNLKF